MLLKTISIKNLLIALIILLLIGIIGPGDSGAAGSKVPAEKRYLVAKKNYTRFMANSKDWGQRRRWETLIKEFDTLARNYPHSKRADDALYLSAGLYSSLYNYSGWSSDLQQSAKRYKVLLKSYHQSRLADDALFNLGLISLKLNDQKRARESWQRLLKEYPNSDMRSRTRAQLGKLTSVKTVTSIGVPRKQARVKKSQFKKKARRKSIARVMPRKKANYRGKARVLDLRHWSSPTYTRVVIDLDSEIQFTKGILKDKHNSKKTKSIYLNLKNSVIPEISREIAINDGILQRVKIAQFNANTVRAVVHVGKIDHYKIFALSNPPRIVIDVIGGDYKKAGRRAKKNWSGKKNTQKPNSLSLAQQLGLGVGTIVLDAGHGGKDPGALSPGGSQEKDVVLDITKRLRDILQKRLKFRVITTRDTDRFIPLEERTVIANTKKADLFISIHANASHNRRVHGVETYFLNLSTDKQAMELAALENATSTKNIGQLQSILNDLMQNSKIKESSRLAGCIQSSLVGTLRKSYSKVNDLGVKQAPFYVLIGAQMPSVLVEVSFISNKMESQRLASPAYRQKIAEGLANGVQKYISEIKLARLQRR
ncbi:N-acetylmuramoyl-L-alanine amidase [bacterium]|nr:N-acetylmuramoyl-L-alanine amidase [bacterium]